MDPVPKAGLLRVRIGSRRGFRGALGFRGVSTLGGGGGVGVESRGEEGPKSKFRVSASSGLALWFWRGSGSPHVALVVAETKGQPARCQAAKFSLPNSVH